MKNLVLIGIAVIVALSALGLTGIAYAYAQTPTPPPFTPGSGYGQGGMMNGRGGMRGGGMMGVPGVQGGYAQTGEYGPMHDEMVSALAGALKISVDDLNAELTSGKTMWQVAEAKGLTLEQFQTIMLDARKAGLAKLVADGTITQAQADWMLSRMQGNFGQNGANPNGCPGGMGGPGMGGGRGGFGPGQRWNNTQPAAPGTNG